MMLRWVLPASGALSVALIVLSAAMALGGSGSHLPKRPTVNVAAIQPDEGSGADPSATGVIMARSNSNGTLYHFSPDGKQWSMSQDNAYRPLTSPSGRWQAFKNCTGQGQPCQLLIWDTRDQSSQPRPVALAGGLRDGLWSPSDDVLAALGEDGSVALVDPASLRVTPVGSGVTAFAWTARGTLLFATYDAPNAALWLAQGGRTRQLTALTSPVMNFVASPDGGRVAFVQDGADGWQLVTASGDGAVAAAGNLGRAYSFSIAVTRAPDSVAISWSPDGRLLSASPATSPFVMFLMPSDGSAGPRAFYPNEGYAGEMKWSPDGSQLAISTYSLDRKQHNVYVLDSVESAQLRFLMDGCIIFWSPDGRFLVAKREPHDLGIGAVRVADGLRWTVSDMRLTPAAWGADDATATKLAQGPARGIGGLGK